MLLDELTEEETRIRRRSFIERSQWYRLCAFLLDEESDFRPPVGIEPLAV